MTKTSQDKYRWECQEHREHGRWLTNPGTAVHYAAQHADRRSPSWSESYGCVPHIIDNKGNDHGRAI